MSSVVIVLKTRMLRGMCVDVMPGDVVDVTPGEFSPSPDSVLPRKRFVIVNGVNGMRKGSKIGDRS